MSKIFPWDYADIWYATSKDGINWEEQGCAVHRGDIGEYDERTVCTPDVLAHNGKYYLVYQAIPQGNYQGDDENTAMAVADNPNGPWEKTCQNILTPMEGGEWFGKEDSYNSGYYLGLTHDPSLFYYNDKYYLYYKCGSNELTSLKHSGADTRWGVATADCVTGPYTHSEYNPVTNSGHETMLWQYKGGIAALLNRDGPEKDTIQYAKDGINFELMAHVYDTPQAGGAFRGKHNDDCPLEGIRWGLCHYDERGSQWNYIVRFDLDNRHPYAFSHQYPKNNCSGLGLW
jgi:beta-xylosidase